MTETKDDLKKELKAPNKIETPLPSIPPIPKLQKKKEDENELQIPKTKKRMKPLFLSNDLASLYWKLAWLQFIAISISYWATLIKGYSLDNASVNGFWAGFSAEEFIDCIYGTITAFSNVVVGAIMKLYNKRIDEKQRVEDETRSKAEKERRTREVIEDDNKRKNKRILDLESQLLNLSMKMQKIAQDQLYASK